MVRWPHWKAPHSWLLAHALPPWVVGLEKPSRHCKSLAFLGQVSMHTSSLPFPVKSNRLGHPGPVGVWGVAVVLCLYWEWVHPAALGGLGSEEPSNLGFEVSGQSPGLDPNAEGPPVCLSTENTFCSGDHVSWHSPLDNSESRIQHMLLTEDPQMQPVRTPFGVVTFLQVRCHQRSQTVYPCGKSPEQRGTWRGRIKGRRLPLVFFSLWWAI